MIRRLALLVAFGSGAALAQPAEVRGLSVRLAVGVDAHHHGELADWQGAERAAVAQEGVALAETDAFPAFPSTRVEVGYVGGRWNYQRDVRYEVGAEVGVGSSGGRLYYEDYSGSFAADRRVRRLIVGAYGEYELFWTEAVWVGARAHLRANPTTTSYRREVVVGDETVEAAETSYRSLPVSVLPALVADVDLQERIQARLHVGYEWSTRPVLPEVPDALPPSARWRWGHGPAVGWSGARIGAGLAFRMGD